MKQTIKPDVLQRMKEDETLQLQIALQLGKKFRTVYQWILDNHQNLTTPAVVELIKQKFGLADDDILETQLVAA